jgi:hypothetical protein
MLAGHNEWQAKIRFYKSEIKNLTTELDEFVSHNKEPEMMAHVEHFQNQFIRQLEVLDITRHEFKQHENAIEQHHQNPLVSLAEQHLNEREKLVQFEKIYHELRDEFHSFLHKELLH